MSAPQPVFRALADPTRRDILLLLRTRDMTIAEVAENFDMTRAAVKKHLIILAEGGLIMMQRRGRETINLLDPMGMTPAVDWLEYFDRYWDGRLAALKSAIEKENS